MPSKRIIYIGELPPPYGGVSVKNQLLLECVFDSEKTEFIDVMACQRLPWKIPATLFRVVRGMIRGQTIVMGTGAKWRDKLLLCAQRVLTGKRGMRKVMKIVMGGRYHQMVEQDSILRRLISEVGSLWVESELMKNEFQKMGINQTFLFPNCRPSEKAIKPSRSTEQPLRLVFFSRICEEKGVDLIMKAYETWKEAAASITLDFYGEIAENFKDRFEKFIGGGADDLCYHGVFDAVNQNVYAELNQYDIMLLPTRWKGEGVPGALVESKMAGIAAIVSDWHANSEVVRDGEEGIVLSSSTAENLAMTVMELCESPKRVCALKEGAYASRTRYCIETYREALIRQTLD